MNALLDGTHGGKEVVYTIGQGPTRTDLERLFCGGGTIEGAADVGCWHCQGITREWMPAPAVSSGPLRPALCAVSSALGTHHVFFGSVGGLIVEL